MSDKQHRKYYAGKYGIIVEIQHPKSSSMRYATQSEIETMPIKERKGISAIVSEMRDASNDIHKFW